MNVVVVGAGPAGMMAAISAAKDENKVILIEKGPKVGKKLSITGKGRCNITFSGDANDFEKNVIRNFNFLRSSFSKFDNNDVVEYFNNLGVKTKIERGARIFPESDSANEVVEALKNELFKYKVKIKYNSTIKDLNIKDDVLESITINNSGITEEIKCDKCIIATGGRSYPVTGSNGDGYELLKKYGHNIVDIKPGLIPIKCYGNDCEKLQGLTLKNISIKVVEKSGELLYNDFGELLFTHFGLSGPVILSMSSVLNRVKDIFKKLEKQEIEIYIDLKPALDKEVLDKRICKDFLKYKNKDFSNSLNELLPRKLIPVIIERSKISPTKQVNEITKLERQQLVSLLKEFKFNIKGFMPIEIAIISCGGIDVKQVNPKTMESKLIKGLYFAGEILDVDGFTGGYNLQIAFSTGYSAGKNF